MPKKSNALFTGRKYAMLELAQNLPINKWTKDDWYILSISDVALFMASELSSYMNLDIEFNHLFMEYIKAPNNEDVPIAMISEKNVILEHTQLVEAFGIERNFLLSESKRIYETKILKNVYKYRKGISFIPKKNKKILIIDDGADSGMKVLLAIKTLNEMGISNIYVAMPILPIEVYDAIIPLTKNVYYLKLIRNYIFTSEYYQQSDEIKNYILDNAWNKLNDFIKKENE